MNENNLDEILYELSECREDERNSQEQLMQTLATAAAILAAILGASFFSNSIKEQTYIIRLGIYCLSVIILLTAISYVVSFGITNTLRFHYIQHLEDKLSLMGYNGPDIIHWMSFSSAINTKNIKHIFNSKYTTVSYIIYFFSALLAVTFCLLLTVVQYYIFDLDNNILIVIPLVFIALSLFIFVIVSIKAKDIYNFSFDFSMKKRKKRIAGTDKMDNNNEGLFIKGLIYFLYPKTRDFQKTLFIPLGYFIGMFLISESMNLNTFILSVKNSLFALIIIEGLVYQARYQLNDIRGLREDIESMRLTNFAKSFLVLCQNKKKGITLSITFITLKIFLSFWLTLKFGGSMSIPLILSISLVTLTTILYEIARTIKCDVAILILVTLGYPLRILVGLWCVIPNLFTTGIQSNKMSISPKLILVYLLSFAAMGGFSVAISWIYEAFHQMKKSDFIVKHHYKYLFDKYQDRYKEYIRKNYNASGLYPLLEKGKVGDCWNLYFLLSISLLSFIICNLNSCSIYVALVECVGILLLIKSCCSSYIRIVVYLFVFIGLKFFIMLYYDFSNLHITIGLYIHQILFAILYCVLRCRFDPSFDFFKFLFALLVGPDTTKVLEDESKNQSSKTTVGLD